jgi:hypothetical protein
VRVQVLRTVGRHPCAGGCRTNGFAFDAELLGRIQAEGGRIVEVPVAWADDSASTFRPLRDGVASFRAVLDMRAGTR